ncbi:hypothetical protein AB205_0040570, partial [Aquarana catesbeiana]
LEKMDSLSVANGSFAIDLFRKLNEKDRKCNLFFSPLSISSALAMIHLGAKGNTAAQMSKLEQELTYEKFADMINPSNLDRTEVELFLPKFKLENFFDLESVLGSLGMTDVFDIGRCDLSGMSGDRDLVLSKVVHKSFVEVNEEGTEATAATGAVIMLRCARFVPRFVCDHPFLFFIVHKQSCSVLFFGRFTSP